MLRLDYYSIAPDVRAGGFRAPQGRLSQARPSENFRKRSLAIAGRVICLSKIGARLFENREGSRMARFFFHVKNGSTFKDEEGENYPNLETARAHAAKIASELAKERAMRALRSR